MRTSTAYFAGVGTVVAAVAAGLGGGYLAANVVSPHEPGVSKLERRMSAAQTAATTAPSEPVARIVATTTAAASPQYEAQQTPQASAQPEPRITASDVAAPAEEKTDQCAAPRSACVHEAVRSGWRKRSRDKARGAAGRVRAGA